MSSSTHRRPALLATLLLLGAGLPGGSRAAAPAPTATPAPAPAPAPEPAAPGKSVRLQLVVTRAAKAKACPDVPDLARRVTDRIGKNPFDPSSDRLVEVEFLRKKKAYSARLRIDPPQGDATPETRELISASSCDELADAVAIAVALTIGRELDAPLVPRPRRGIDPVTGVGPGRRAGPAAAVPQPPRLGLYLEAGLGAGFGLSPGPSMIARLGAGASISRWRGALFVFTDLLGRHDTAGVTIFGSILAGQVALCRDVHPLELCLTAAAGKSSFSGKGITKPDPSGVSWVVVGPRADLVWVSNSSVSLLLTMELHIALVRARISVDESQVWQTPLVGGAVSLGLRFPLR